MGDIEFINTLIMQATEYHNHKELMGYGAITFYLAGTSTLMISDFWLDYPLRRRVGLLFIVTLSTAVTVMFVNFQLTKRRVAAIRVAAAMSVASDWISQAPGKDALTPTTPACGDNALSWPKALVQQCSRVEKKVKRQLLWYEWEVLGVVLGWWLLTTVVILWPRLVVGSHVSPRTGPGLASENRRRARECGDDWPLAV